MVLVSIGEHSISFCEHEHFDFLSYMRSEHFEETFHEHRAKKKQFANKKAKLIEVIEN